MPASYVSIADPYTPRYRLVHLAWVISWAILCQWTPRPFHAWRAWILRCWGARLGQRCRVYPKVRIWAPWELQLGDEVCIGNGAEIYNVARISVGHRAVISQDAYLCTASHDFRQPEFPQTSAPITLGDCVWVAARAIVLPGVEMGARSVVGAGSVLTRSVPAGSVCAGNPARVVRTIAV